MTRPCDRARECWERIEEGDGRAAGEARLLWTLKAARARARTLPDAEGR
jgi:hypothetical protein